MSKVQNVAKWTLNIGSSVLIIFANKLLFGTYQFQYPTLVTALHLLVSTVVTVIWKNPSKDDRDSSSLPRQAVFLFAILANLSYVGMNLSLSINTVSFYQISKLAILPLICILQYTVVKESQSLRCWVAVSTVLLGSALVTIVDLDLDLSSLGFIIALLAVVSTAIHQMLVRYLQLKYSLSPFQFMLSTGPAQALLLLILGPFVDQMIFGGWIADFKWSLGPQTHLIMTTSLLAVLVNISQIACLGSFSAVSFQVMGAAKMILVLVGSWFFFSEPVTEIRGIGAIIALIGMISYSYFKINDTMSTGTRLNKG